MICRIPYFLMCKSLHPLILTSYGKSDLGSIEALDLWLGAISIIRTISKQRYSRLNEGSFSLCQFARRSFCQASTWKAICGTNMTVALGESQQTLLRSILCVRFSGALVFIL